MPFGDVIALLLPSVETATNKESSGDQHTETQELAIGASIEVQFMPLLEYMIWSVPVDTPSKLSKATATNKESSGDQHTDVH